MTPGKARLFDLVAGAGDRGLELGELEERTGLRAACLKAHIWQINEALEDTGYRIASRGWGYVLREPPAREPRRRRYRRHQFLW